jgi:PadR family transcriptional regulator, regulatory protein PadR
MAKPWKPGRRQRRVLLVLLSGAPNLSGYPIGRAAQAGSFTVYPVLDRLEDCGWVTGEWGPGKPGSGRRRFYKLTPEGRKAVLLLLGLEA